MNATELLFNTVVKFRVLPCDLSFVLTNFLWLNETSKKNRPLFKRIIAQYAMKFLANFRGTFIEKSREQERNSRILLALLLHNTVYTRKASHGFISTWNIAVKENCPLLISRSKTFQSFSMNNTNDVYWSNCFILIATFFN